MRPPSWWPVRSSVSFFCGSGFLVLRFLARTENQLWEQFSEVPVDYKTSGGNEVLDDEDKIAKAKEDLAQWTGDRRVYEEDIALLGEIIEPSPYSEEAQALILKWKAKGAELEKRAAKKPSAKK